MVVQMYMDEKSLALGRTTKGLTLEEEIVKQYISEKTHTLNTLRFWAKEVASNPLM